MDKTVAALIRNPKGEILLVKRFNRPYWKLPWQELNHADDENCLYELLDCVLGIDVDYGQLTHFKNYFVNGGGTCAVYALTTDAQPHPKPTAGLATKWFKLEDLKSEELETLLKTKILPDLEKKQQLIFGN